MAPAIAQRLRPRFDAGLAGATSAGAGLTSRSSAVVLLVAGLVTDMSRLPSLRALLGCRARRLRRGDRLLRREGEPLARALIRSGSRHEFKVPLGELAAGRAVDQSGIDDGPGLLVGDQHAVPVRREVLVPPGDQREEHGPEVAAALGQYEFVARRPLTVELALEQSCLDQALEPARQHVGRDTEALLELVEPLEPVKGVANDQD